MKSKLRSPESNGEDVVDVNCVKTVRTQLRHKLADISSSIASPGDPCRLIKFAEVSLLRKGSREAQKVAEHVKRRMDNMEVKQLKNKGRKRKNQNSRPKPGRFAITGLISGKNADLLKFLFRKFSGEERWSEEIARYGEFAVTRADFQCLSPATPLSCKVINICAAYLNEEDSACWFLPTFFGERARSNAEPSSYKYWLECTVSMCGLKRFHRRLHMCSKIFIPLRDNIDDCWFLLVVNLDNQTALLWDSLPDANSVARRMYHARDVMTLLQEVFSLEMTMFDQAYYLFPSFSVTLAEVNPTNAQKYDSGLFVIRHMQHYLETWSIGFKSEEHRNRIALEIVRHPRNEHGRDVIAAVGMQNNIQDKIPRNPERANLLVSPTGRKFRSHRKRRDRT